MPNFYLKGHITMKKADITKKLIIEALLRRDNDITALNGMKFLTTRITNHIVELRKNGLEIETKTIKTDDTYYGKYQLVQSKDNIEKAYALLEDIQVPKEN